MGLFYPKISPSEFQHVQSRMVQLQDSVNLINTTTKPDVFFKRLHFTLDLLLDLQGYEKYKIFKGSRPSEDYRRILNNLEATVNDFIDRAIADNNKKVARLKTEKGKQKKIEDFADALIAAFDCAHSFWIGDRGFPHYSGPLFTAQNYQRVHDYYDASCDLID